MEYDLNYWKNIRNPTPTGKKIGGDCYRYTYESLWHKLTGNWATMCRGQWARNSSGGVYCKGCDAEISGQSQNFGY